jgi:hypothetical protein
MRSCLADGVLIPGFSGVGEPPNYSLHRDPREPRRELSSGCNKELP